MINTRNRRITKAVDGWNPPDTDELEKIVLLLNKIGTRIHSLRIACCLNESSIDGRIRRVMTGRKTAIEKAYQKGRRDGWKRRKKNRPF